jgi:flavin reductase (DIM6/NTAB) family NADH-FMN oxidoreductase RutF
MPAPTPEEFRRAMALLPTAVTIITTRGEAGPAGATANAVVSLSLDPPLMLACLDRGSRTLEVLRAADKFGISVLGERQSSLAREFASKVPHSEKFRDVSHAEREGVPMIDGAIAWISCRLRELHEGGDHVIAVGEVLSLTVNEEAAPLVFHQGEYRALS